MLSIGKLTVEQPRYCERQVAQGRDDCYAGRGEGGTHTRMVFGAQVC